MKVVHVDPAPGWRGGERQVFLLTRELGRRGIESIVVAAPGEPLAERVGEHGGRVVPVRMRGDLDLAAILATKNVLRREQPDLVHLHTSRAHGVGGLAARWAGSKPVLVTRRVELEPRGFFARWKYAHLADHYVAISDAVRDSLQRGGVPADRITDVPSGVELVSAAPRSGSAPSDVFTIGTFAAFTPQKDPETWAHVIADVCRESPSSRALWAGEGELRPRVEGVLRDAGVLDRVEIPGFVEDLTPLWDRLDAFFLPSAFEALGTVLLDAMAHGVPIVATRVGGIPEVVRDGREGLLVDPGDRAGLAAALHRLRADPELRVRLGEAGRARAAEYEIGGIVDRLCRLYESLIGRAA